MNYKPQLPVKRPGKEQNGLANINSGPAPSAPIDQLQKTLEREIASLRRQRRHLDCPHDAVLLLGMEELEIDRRIELKSRLLLTLKNLAQIAGEVAPGNAGETSQKKAKRR